jgi:hypothetical protein
VNFWFSTLLIVLSEFACSSKKSPLSEFTGLQCDLRIAHPSDGIMGYRTPNIDRIADEGMRFIVLDSRKSVFPTQRWACRRKIARKDDSARKIRLARIMDRETMILSGKS